MGYRKTERVGSMNEVIQFLTPTITRGNAGGETRTYATGSNVWCSVEWKRTGTDETEVANRVQAFATAVFRIRYDSSITEKMRIAYNSDEFNILALMPDAKREYMEIEAVKDTDG